MPSVIDVSNDYRSQLIRREAAAERELARAYIQVRRDLETYLARITEELMRFERFGVDPSPDLLFNQARVYTMLEQIEGEVDRIAKGLGPTLERMTGDAIQLGDELAAQLLGSEGVPITVRLPNDVLQQMVARMRVGSPVEQLLSRLGPDAAEQIRQKLLAGLAAGWGPGTVALELQKTLGGNLARAMTLARTEMIQAYRNAALFNYRRFPGLIQGWIWTAAVASYPPPCPVCTALHGRVFPLSAPFGSHPNCVVGDTLISGLKPDAASARWYAGSVVDIETSLGHRLTVTPNHPILTPQGWIAAAGLNEGDEVISSALGERPFPTINPDEYQVPTRAKDLVRSLFGAEGMTSVSVPTTAEDFHGDGMDAEVEVVYADRLLRYAFDTPIFKPSLEDHFVPGDSKLAALSGFGTLDSFLAAMRSPTSCLVCGSGIPAMFFGGTLGHHQPVRVGNRTSLDSSGLQTTYDGRSGYSNRLGYGVLRFPGQVTADDLVNGDFDPRAIVAQLDSFFGQNPIHNLLGDTEAAAQFFTRHAGSVQRDEIVKVRRRPWSGHVYNLQTSEEWYISNGIISHNCRCSPAPLTRGSRVPFDTGPDWFDRQSRATQMDVLGPMGYLAYQDGVVGLSDFAKLVDDPLWGPTWKKRSMTELLGDRKSRYWAMMAV